MRRIAGAVAIIALAGLAGCHAAPGAATGSEAPAPGGTAAAPALPSVVATGCSTWQTRPGTRAGRVHVRTTLTAARIRAPQAGVRGLATVSSIDVAFMAGGVPVGWALEVTPPGTAGMVIGNGRTELTVLTSGIYLSGRWTPRCQVARVYWLPGVHH
jgi:hypothetical protein